MCEYRKDILYYFDRIYENKRKKEEKRSRYGLFQKETRNKTISDRYVEYKNVGSYCIIKPRRG